MDTEYFCVFYIPQSLILIQKKLKSLKFKTIFVIYLSSKLDLNSQKSIYNLYTYILLSLDNIHIAIELLISQSMKCYFRSIETYYVVHVFYYISELLKFLIFKIHSAPNILNKRSQICSQFRVTKITSDYFNA